MAVILLVVTFFFLDPLLASLKDKEAIIEWAVARWPDLPWKRVKRKGAMCLTANNEHMSDACAIIDTGLKTQEFLQSVQLMRAAMPRAA